MRYLYKYMSKKRSDEFLQTGSIRVGTVHDFRSADHKPGVSDQHEGFAYSEIKSDTPRKFSEMTDVEQANLGLGTIIPWSLLGDLSQGGISAGFDGAFIRESPDFYVLCFAMAPDRDAMKKLGCDTCLQISQPELFINRITRSLKGIASMVRHQGKVDYSGKETSYSTVDTRYPFMTKHEIFSYQNEYRAVWSPSSVTTKIITPQIITSPKAAMLCKEIQI